MCVSVMWCVLTHCNQSPPVWSVNQPGYLKVCQAASGLTRCQKPHTHKHTHISERVTRLSERERERERKRERERIEYRKRE